MFVGVGDELPEAGPARRDRATRAGTRRRVVGVRELHKVAAARRDLLRPKPGRGSRVTGEEPSYKVGSLACHMQKS